MSLQRRWFPRPFLSAALLALWLMLARSTSPGQIVLGLSIGLAIPVLTAKLILPKVQVARPGLVIRFVIRVVGDVVVSSLAVARGVLRWETERPSAGFVLVPLELRDPLGLAVLAMVTTIVPGTVWTELAADRSTLLLHVWDVGEKEAFIARYKARYEQPLREIFE